MFFRAVDRSQPLVDAQDDSGAQVLALPADPVRDGPQVTVRDSSRGNQLTGQYTSDQHNPGTV